LSQTKIDGNEGKTGGGVAGGKAMAAAAIV